MSRWAVACLLLLVAGAAADAQNTGVNPTVGSVWTYLGATYGAGWVPPTPLSSIVIWGADPTGVADSTIAWNKAVAATPCVIYVPPGTYKIGGTVTVAQPCSIIGAGAGLSTIVAASPTGDVFSLSGTGLVPYSATTMSNLSFRSSVTRTANAYVHCLAPHCLLYNLAMNDAAAGVIFDQYATSSVARDLSFRNTVPASVYNKSTDILLTGNVEAVLLDNIVSDVDAATINNMPRSCIELQAADATMIIAPQLIHCQSVVLVDPSTASQTVLSTQIFGGFLDTPLAPAGSDAFGLELIAIAGAITRFTATGTWFGDACNGASCNGDGINFSLVAGVADGFSCIGCQLVLNSRHGANISNQNWNDIRFVGGDAVSNGGPVFNGGANFNGVVNAHNITIDSVAQSQFGVNPSNAGVIMAAGSAKWTIINNDFTGVATPIIGNTNCGNLCVISGNTGYNPVRASSIAFGASPAPLCALGTPETDYISGGTVSKIEVQTPTGTVATGLTGGSFALGPNDCIIVTYSAMPTGIRDVQ